MLEVVDSDQAEAVQEHPQRTPRVQGGELLALPGLLAEQDVEADGMAALPAGQH